MNRYENNPFSAAWLVYPIDQRDDYVRFCQTENPAHSDEAPFPRRADMWFASLALAARNGLPPADLRSRNTVNMVQGTVFGSDVWRVRVLMLLVLAIDQSIEVVENPARMMTIANGLAAAGQPLVVEMLNRGQDRPIWNLSTALDELLR